MSFFLSTKTKITTGFPESNKIKSGCTSLLQEQCQLDFLVCEFSWHLMIVDDLEMKKLNRNNRGIDHTTDVLSFPQLPFENASGTYAFNKSKNKLISIRDYIDWQTFDILPPLPGEEIELGDVVLSAPQCELQAKRIGHDIELEFWRLCCHGLLHLFGYDHVASEEDRKRMEKQEDVLFLSVTQA